MGLFFFGTSAAGGAGGGIRKVADAAARLALSPAAGDLVIQLDTNDLWYYNSALAWELYVEDFDNNDIDTVIAGLAAHLADTTDAHAASAIGFTAVGTIASTNAQSAIAEVATDAAASLSAHVAAGDPHPAYALDTDLSAHTGQVTGAHAASAISFTAGGTVAATNVQTAIAEVASEADTRLLALEAASHAAASIGNFDTTPNSKGASISGQAISLAAANATNPGGLTSSAQSIGGEKRLVDGAQVGAATALGASEIFGVISTTKGARPLPSMTSAQRTAIATPATGLMVYDTDNKGAMFYDGTQWQFMDGRATIAAAQAPADAATLTPLGYRSQILPVSGAAAAAVSLADLAITNAKDGDVLTLIGTSLSATVTVVSATNTVLNGSMTLALDNTLTLQFYSSKWREMGRTG